MTGIAHPGTADLGGVLDRLRDGVGGPRRPSQSARLPTRRRASASLPLSVIVDCEPHPESVLGPVETLLKALADARVDAEVLLACSAVPSEVPAGAEAVVYHSAGRGDRFDAAAERARGEILAFVDTRVRVTPQWAQRAVEIFADPEVSVVGGPIIPAGQRRSQRVAATIMTNYLGATPAAHNARMAERHFVQEVASTNLLIRRDVFDAVGGFQTPAGGGESVRLCYKVRSLLGRKINYEPDLALHRTGPMAGGLLSDIAGYGRFRGDVARRLPEAGSPLYALPAVFCLILVAGGVAVAADPGLATFGLVALGALVVAHLAQAARTLLRPSQLRGQIVDRSVATAVVPVVLLVFGVSFLRGYLGHSLSDISPRPERARPLRVLVLNWRDVAHPWAGGAEFYIHNMAKRWVAEDIEVGWLTQRYAGSSRNDVIDRIRIHRVGGKLTQYPRAALAQLRLRRSYDVLIDCENGIPFFTPLYCRRPKVLVVHHVHQEIFRRQLPRQIRWLAMWLEGTLMPRAYRNTAVVAVSDSTRSDLIELGFDPGHITVITNGVDAPALSGIESAPHPTVLCMGRLKPQKSVDVLIRAMAKVVETLPDAELHVVGQGPDRTRLERLAWSSGLAHNVRFHGFVSSSARDIIAARSWIAACPSSFEGWGVVCMEASARGLPVVASNVKGLRDSVRDGETGVLVAHGDVEGFAQAMVDLLRDDDRRRAMGAAGRAWAARHTWSESATAFARLLRSQASGALSAQRPAVMVRDSVLR